MPVPKELLVGIETADDAAVYQLNDEQALIATTDFFMPIVDDPFDFGRIAATNAISDVYAMGGTADHGAGAGGHADQRAVHRRPSAASSKAAASVCRAAGIPIAGGHTIDSVEAIYGLVALGLVHPKRVKRNADAQPGDLLVLGKPLGVGVMSAALKKGELGDAGYAQMIATTTQLNTPGPDLAALPGVHALTDVTGFGLAGHALEMARGARCDVQLDWATRAAAGGRARRWRRRASSPARRAATGPAMGPTLTLPGGFAPEDQALLTDPQTSGGLLVSCAPAALDEVLAIFHRHGFARAAVVGSVVASGARPRLVVS